MKRSKHDRETSTEKLDESSDMEVEKKSRMTKRLHTKRKHHDRERKSKHHVDSDKYEVNKHKSHEHSKIKIGKRSNSSSSEEEVCYTDKKVKRSKHDTNTKPKHERIDSSDSESSKNNYSSKSSHKQKHSVNEVENSEREKKHRHHRKHQQSSKVDGHSSSSKSEYKQSSDSICVKKSSKYKPDYVEREIKQEDNEDKYSKKHSHRSHLEKPSIKSEINESRHRSFDRPQSSRCKKRDQKNNFCNGSEEYEWGKKDKNNKDFNTVNNAQLKQKPDFGLSGKLTEDTNTYNGVVIKYSEPSDARKPKRRWRLYPFKDDKQMPVLHIHRQSAFLLGRDRKVADIPIDHPSCSKQHAALQYRLTDYSREDGSKGKRIRLYIIDLESANGTFVNNKKIETKRYIELLEKDVIKFGFSSREYVLLHEHSKDSDLDDDVTDEQ